ncbi:MULTISPECIES: hypothetical protein [unclassified Pseudomonas]|uniref:hypothetical protein n=1 Tax=unclassified Pseudomonas TaxID=196821 RepID=UPI00192B9BDD|nr:MULTISPECIES: hypothetical protein [unclassified Pseudomonas]MDI3372053.1 hypothetical protein [Pseudomonas sp. V104_10]QQZ35630.1 hypothetical protein IF103_20805 [Pseudomonas sp. SK2]
MTIRLWPIASLSQRQLWVDSCYPPEEPEPGFGEWIAERFSDFHHPVMAFSQWSGAPKYGEDNFRDKELYPEE